MGKLDASMLRYMTKKHFRVLSAVEKAMKDHEVVPEVVIEAIAALHHGGCHKILGELLKYRLVAYDKGGRQVYGYRLTNSGHDYLALNILSGKDVITSLGHKIGVGKESDIYNVLSPDNEDLCLKLHRLGRASFRQVKNKRDYHKNRSFVSWVHLSNASASKEFHFLQALSDRGFAVPKPIDCNRHAVVMELINGTPMHQLRELSDPANVYDECMNFVVRLASCGLIHGDFNEFNIMVRDDETIVVYDLPQTVSTSHVNAEFYFDRDVQCIRTYFQRRFGFDGAEFPTFKDIVKTDCIDVEVEASGFTKTHLNQLAELFEKVEVNDESRNKGDCSQDDDDEDDSQESSGSQDDDDSKEDYVAVATGGEAVQKDGQEDTVCILKTATVSKDADLKESDSESDDSNDECDVSSENKKQDSNGDKADSEGGEEEDSKGVRKATASPGNLILKEKRHNRRTRRGVASSEDWDTVVKKEIKREKYREKIRTAQSRATKPRHRKNERRDASSSVKPAPVWDF